MSRNLEMLTAFHAVAEVKSFTQAGEKLGKSKSFLSKQVIMLETYLGTSLFLRTTRHLSLTEEGRVLQGYAQQILKLTDEAEKHLQDLTHGMSGQLKISSPLSLGLKFFPIFFQAAKKVMPKVKMIADLSNENRDLAEEHIDFAIRATPVHQNDLEIHYLGKIRDVICAIPKIAKKYQTLKSPHDIKDDIFILYSHNPEWNQWKTSPSSKKTPPFTATGKYEVNHYEAARALCLGGQGIARLPRYSVEAELKSGALVELFSESEFTSQPLYLLCPRKGLSTPKHKIAKALILQWFKSRDTLFG